MASIDEEILDRQGNIRPFDFPNAQIEYLDASLLNAKRAKISEIEIDDLDAGTLTPNYVRKPSAVSDANWELLWSLSRNPVLAQETRVTPTPTKGEIVGSNLIWDAGNGTFFLFPYGPGVSGPGDKSGLYFRASIEGTNNLALLYDGSILFPNRSVSLTAPSTNVLRINSPTALQVNSIAPATGTSLTVGPDNGTLAVPTTNLVGTSSSNRLNIYPFSNAGSVVIRGGPEQASYVGIAGFDNQFARTTFQSVNGGQTFFQSVNGHIDNAFNMIRYNGSKRWWRHEYNSDTSGGFDYYDFRSGTTTLAGTRHILIDPTGAEGDKVQFPAGITYPVPDDEKFELILTGYMRIVWRQIAPRTYLGTLDTGIMIADNTQIISATNMAPTGKTFAGTPYTYICAGSVNATTRVPLHITLFNTQLEIRPVNGGSFTVGDSVQVQLTTIGPIYLP